MSQCPAKGTKPRPTRQPTGQMTYRQCQDARRQSQHALDRRYALALRAPAAHADPKLVKPPEVTTRLVRKVAAIIDADPTLVEWLTDKFEAGHKRPGRPRELAVRTALTCFVLQVIVRRDFHLYHLPRLMAQMTWRVRRDLGIAYLRNGLPTQLSYGQLLDLFHDMADVFDAWSDDLGDLDNEPEVRAARAADLQELGNRLVRASNHAAPLWSGNAASDATLKSAHERPPDSVMNSKIERRGRDGDAGPSVPLSKIAVDANGEIDPSLFVSIDPVEVVKAATAGRTKRKHSWPSTWSFGAAWVGRANKSKSVHGYALHTAVRSDGPCLVETFTVTPANGAPVEAGLPMLRGIYDHRSTDPAVLAAVAAGEAFILGDVVADGPDTTTDWMLQVKAMNASPIGRLHRTGQEGVRYHKVGRGKKVGEVAVLGGHPVCECISHTPLADLRYPTFPFTSAALQTYQTENNKIDQFERSPNGAVRPDGSRQRIAPHADLKEDGHVGDCEHCVQDDGSPVRGFDGRPRARCCQVRSRLLPREVLALDQGPRFGSRPWYRRWTPRNRVEGSYGILKNLAVVNFCRSFHHFVGLARETIVTVFAIVAYNFHMLNQWTAQQAFIRLPSEDDNFDLFGPLPDAQPVAAAPKVGKAPEPFKAPKGLDFLGLPLAPPG